MHSVLRLRRVAAELLAYAQKTDLIKDIKDSYGIEIDESTEEDFVKVLSDSLKRLPPDLVRDCGIKTLGFEDQGPSKEYYPNHGRYIKGTLFLNQNIIDDPRVISDKETGASFNKFDQTFYHELGHGWDEAQSDTNEALSFKEEWMSLSKWTKEPIPGYKRLHIQEKGSPELVGEYYYSPGARFTRFYAKRNPWDDYADSFSYYVAGLKSFLSKNKVRYFDGKLGKYYNPTTSFKNDTVGV